MANRWTILAALFLARSAMGFQFQSVASLSPLISDSYGASLADIGFLIGLYLAPGLIVALPGGAIAARFGDKRVVNLAMAMMLAGCVLISFGPGWNSLMAGRILAGVGGVMLNVVMTKMVVDWFAGREMSTALAIFINSWPVGIGLGLVALPYVAETYDLAAAWSFVMVYVAVGWAVFAGIYRAPENAASVATSVTAVSFPVVALGLAGVIWALYNAALAMVFSFGVEVLIERGWALASAGSLTSSFMFVASIALPLGGILADRTGRRDTVIAVSLLGYACLMPLLLYAPAGAVPVVLAVAGALFALGGGPIMTLPAMVLSPKSRAFGMGVFFTIYYVLMMLAPGLAGALAEWTGSVGSAIWLGVGMVLICLLALVLFRQSVARRAVVAA